jgi:competence protein ComEA
MTLLALVTAALPATAQESAKPPPQATAARSNVVDLNTASGDELETLPGIGPSRARAILELRARLKRFTRIEDLLRVKGIGRATFRRLRPFVRV